MEADGRAVWLVPENDGNGPLERVLEVRTGIVIRCEWPGRMELVLCGRGEGDGEGGGLIDDGWGGFHGGVGGPGGRWFRNVGDAVHGRQGRRACTRSLAARLLSVRVAHR